jgi:hypothetical protein
MCALIFMDGFDHYGASSTGRTNMLAGVYADVDSNSSPTTTNPRNSTHSYATPIGAAVTGLRRVFGASKTTVGCGGAFYFTNLPDTADLTVLMQFLDTDNVLQVGLVLNTDGKIAAKRGTIGEISNGSADVLGTTATTVISAGVWHHVEAKYVASETVGTVTVWVDEVEVLAITGADTVNTLNVEASQVTFMRCADVNVLPCYLDDIYAWDDSGSYNKSQIGDKDILPYWYTGDGATSAWVRNTGSTDYEQVDDLIQDGDTTYLQAAAASDVEELTLSGVPSTVAGIVGIALINCMRKTQAGASSVQAAAVETGGAVASGTERPMTEEYAYYSDVIERNPVSGTPAWTYTTLNTMSLRLTRTV